MLLVEQMSRLERFRVSFIIIAMSQKKYGFACSRQPQILVIENQSARTYLRVGGVCSKKLVFSTAHLSMILPQQAIHSGPIFCMELSGRLTSQISRSPIRPLATWL